MKKSIENNKNKNLVDNAWECGCGALNAACRTECGECNLNQ